MKKILNDNRGAAAVEFALIAPLLFALFFGIIEFGLYIYNQQMLTNAAREGARVGILATDPRVPANSIESVVQNYCAGSMITFGAQNNPILNPNPPSGYASDAAFGDHMQVVSTPIKKDGEMKPISKQQVHNSKPMAFLNVNCTESRSDLAMWYTFSAHTTPNEHWKMPRRFPEE